ncbi:MAG: hypothetical protein ACTSO9_06540 [Candidatus Helarchaeota archaeon]
MNIFEIIDYNLQALNTAHLINSIIRSSIVLVLGILALIFLYSILPQKIEKLSIDDLNSLKDRENLPIILGIIGFFILGTTGYAYAISRLINVYYPVIVSAWVNISFLFLTSLCIQCLKNIKYGLIPIIIGWTGATGSFISIFLGGTNPILGLLFETIILSFLPSLSIWFLQNKVLGYSKKIILIFGILLLAYGIIKLLYFIFFISGINVGTLEFLYNLSPTILDIICIYGPVTVCYIKCQND